jgi:GMP synthase (glutamine-hydrolysing)
MRIHCILHESFEGLATIEHWISKNKHTLTFTHLYLNETFPDPNGFELHIIMGGTASVYESGKYDWLKEEKLFLKMAIAHKCKILGICFGAQLLADVLGSKVYKGTHKEIGWFPVRFNKAECSNMTFLPDALNVFHWHGDTFDIPESAVRIGSSEATPNQGFIYGNNIIALQFHLEMNFNQIQLMLESGGNELIEGNKYIQGKNHILMQNNFFADNNQLMIDILDYISAS